MQSDATDDVLVGVSAPEPPAGDRRDGEKGSARPPSPTATVNAEAGQGDDGITIPLGLFALSDAFSLADLLRSHGLHDLPLPAANPKHRSPFEWPRRKKIVVLIGPVFAAMLAAYAAGAYAMAQQPLMAKWGVSSTVYNIGITVFVAGFGVAPMLLAPISEVYGRYGVFAGAGLVFFLGMLGCAVTDTLAGMIVARFVTGCAASVYATLTGGAIADLYHKEDRNTPMAAYSLTIMAGTGLGPLISGPVVDRAGWRWIFYHQMILLGVATLNIVLTMDETRSNVVLRRKCAALNKHFESLSSNASREAPALGEKAGDQPAPTLPRKIRFVAEVAEPELKVSLIYRAFAFPLRLLLTESVVFWFSLWVSFAWAVLYMQFGSIPFVFRNSYGFSSTQVGAIYTAIVVGSLISGFSSIFLEPYLRRLFPARMAGPEGRLLLPCFASVFLPAGLFWFGWSTHAHTHWIVPSLAIGSITMGILSIYLAVFNYLADTYHQYSSSAQAAQSMCRNLLAGIFPLITHLLWGNLSYGAAGSLLGAIGFVLMGVPWVLSLFGPQIRARSPFAGDLKESSQESQGSGNEEAAEGRQ
ncbi:hypothetical protein VUR80DRAFT_2332 [Thermomyces stellatus]